MVEKSSRIIVSLLLPRKSAWRRCGVSRHTERIYQDLRVLSDSLDDVPALLFGGGDEGADDRKVGCTGDATEAAGDFLLDLHHAGVAFGLIVGEGHGRIVEEAQNVLFSICEAQEKIMSGSARLATATFGLSFGGGGRERRLRLVEGHPSARMAS